MGFVYFTLEAGIFVSIINKYKMSFLSLPDFNMEQFQSIIIHLLTGNKIHPIALCEQVFQNLLHF